MPHFHQTMRNYAAGFLAVMGCFLWFGCFCLTLMGGLFLLVKNLETGGQPVAGWILGVAGLVILILGQIAGSLMIEFGQMMRTELLRSTPRTTARQWLKRVVVSSLVSSAPGVVALFVGLLT